LKLIFANGIIWVQNNLRPTTGKPAPLFRETQLTADLNPNFNRAIWHIHIKRREMIAR
jgi:hypothetical protein